MPPPPTKIKLFDLEVIPLVFKIKIRHWYIL